MLLLSKSTVRPILEYGSVMWSLWTCKLINCIASSLNQFKYKLIVTIMLNNSLSSDLVSWLQIVVSTLRSELTLQAYGLTSKQEEKCEKRKSRVRLVPDTNIQA